MKSAIAITYELDDINAATEELKAQIEGKFTFGKNTVAILHGQPDMEIGRLSANLSRELGCSVIGGTTAVGALLTNKGYHELAVVIHVISGDDCLFAAAISGCVTDNPEKEISDTYQKAYQSLKNQDDAAEPEMVICIAPMIQGFASDSVLEKISELCDSLPVFGFIAGDDFEFCKQQVYLDEISGGDRLAILLVSGNVKPIFKTINLVGKQALEKKLVTKSHDNVICEIDGKPAYEYIKGFPFIDDETKNLFNYQFFVEMNDSPNDDGVPVSRALNTYNKETGEVTCFANVPENSYIGLLYCDGNDVVHTSEAGIKEFIERLMSESGGYEYSTVLIATCSLRNAFLADMRDMEGNLVRDLFPNSLTVSGMHAFGEIAPTSVCQNKAVNRFHNATFTICAF